MLKSVSCFVLGEVKKLATYNPFLGKQERKEHLDVGWRLFVVNNFCIFFSRTRRLDRITRRLQHLVCPKTKKKEFLSCCRQRKETQVSQRQKGGDTFLINAPWIGNLDKSLALVGSRIMFLAL